MAVQIRSNDRGLIQPAGGGRQSIASGGGRCGSSEIVEQVLWCPKNDSKSGYAEQGAWRRLPAGRAAAAAVDGEADSAWFGDVGVTFRASTGRRVVQAGVTHPGGARLGVSDDQGGSSQQLFEIGMWASMAAAAFGCGVRRRLVF